MAIFEAFSSKVQELKEKVTEFKTNHKMASQAVSAIISNLPFPFNTFGQTIWDGLEPKENGPEQMLEILERIRKNDELSFMKITNKIDEVIKNNASKNDINEIAEKIITSEKSVIDILGAKLDDIKKIALDTKSNTEKILDMMKEERQIFQNLSIGATVKPGQKIDIPQEVQNEINRKDEEIQRLTSEIERTKQELPSDIDYLLRRGAYFYNLGEYEKAIGIWDLVLEKQKANSDALYNKRSALEKLVKKGGLAAKPDLTKDQIEKIDARTQSERITAELDKPHFIGKMSPEAIKAELSALRGGYDDSVLTQDQKDKRNKRITELEAALKAS